MAKFRKGNYVTYVGNDPRTKELLQYEANVVVRRRADWITLYTQYGECNFLAKDFVLCEL